MRDDATENASPREIPLPEAAPPVLEYRTPRPRQGDKRRGHSVAMGMGSVAASLGLAGLIGIGSGFNGLIPTLILAMMGSIIFGAFDVYQKRHAGFFMGMILGVIVLIGGAMLLFAIVCGPFK